MGLSVMLCWLEEDEMKVRHNLHDDMGTCSVRIGDTQGEVSLVLATPDQIASLHEYLRKLEVDWRNRLAEQDKLYGGPRG